MSFKARTGDVLVGLVLGGGMLLSLATDDWDWFSRSGSAVVVIGIVLTSSQIREHMQRLRALRGQLLAQSRRDWASDENKRALIRASSDQERTWEGEGHGLYMLIAGTLVWGFGDLLGLVFG